MPKIDSIYNELTATEIYNKIAKEEICSILGF